MTEPASGRDQSGGKLAAIFVPRSVVDPDVARVARLLVPAAGGVGVITLALAVTRWATEGVESPVGAILGAASVVFLTIPLLLRATGSVRFAGALLPLAGVLATISASATEGGISSEALFWLPFVPLVAVLFVGARGAVVFGLLGLASLVGLFISGAGEPPVAPADELGRDLRFAGASGAVVFGAVLGWLYEANRLRASATLARSEARARAMLEASPDALILVSAEGRVLEEALPVHGRLPPQLGSLAGRDIREVFPRVTADTLLAQLARAVSKGSLETEECQLDLDGRRCDLEVRVAPLGGQGGELLVVLRDITERRRVDRLKDEFVSTVSHELRTPLTAIRGAIGLLSGGEVEELSERGAAMLELADRNAQRLGGLVDDLLDVQRMEAGAVRFVHERVPLEGFLGQAVELNQSYASRFGVRVEVAGPVPDADLFVDRERLHQIVANLITNAVKHSDSGATVRVRATADPAAVRIAVEDEGPGIAPSDRERLFEPFHRLEDARGGGAGLGLHIVSRLVEHLGGTIAIESSLGQGATFTVTLPRERPAA